MNARRQLVRFVLPLILTLAVASPSLAQSQARIIVKLRDAGAKSAATAKARTEKLARLAGTPLRHVREMALGADVVIADLANEAEGERIAARLAADTEVAFAQVDHRVHALQAQLPVNDVFAAQQHYLDNDATSVSVYAAWEVTHGSPGIVVAVVDSGYRPHAGMAGRILPGYDMISDLDVANDGDGRDADASDPGDWVSVDEATPDCPAHGSIWHGTSVAGVIGANTNDGAWTAGIDWNAKILPVRVLGKCGGYDSDVLDGIAWAAGLDVPGVPRNPTPAQVINLSLGATSSCPQGYASVAQAAYAHGITRAIVAAAGNDAQDVSTASPANCPGFLAIASTTAVSGNLAKFSNYGEGITLSAPGGAANFRTPADSVVVLSNAGDTTPEADNVVREGGTSFSAPMVSGTVALMLAVAPWLSPDQVHAVLVASAKPFPATSDCTTDRCGAGILDAGAAVRGAQAIAPPAINYEGLWWKAPAESESGWGINLAHQGDIIFATWFTYDTTGKAWWLSVTANRTADNVYAGTLYQTHGPAFNAIPFDPHAVTRTAVGNATLTFTDGTNGTFAYTVNGITQTKAITREVFGPPPVCMYGALPNLAAATNYQDLWWASPPGSESGWGVNLTHQGDTIFATWFTYDLDGSPLWLSVTANRSAPSTYTGTLYRTAGPPFNAVPFDPTRVTRTSVGTATFTFTDGANGTFAYTVNGVSQVKAFTRQVFVAPGTVCQ